MRRKLPPFWGDMHHPGFSLFSGVRRFTVDMNLGNDAWAVKLDFPLTGNTFTLNSHKQLQCLENCWSCLVVPLTLLIYKNVQMTSWKHLKTSLLKCWLLFLFALSNRRGHQNAPRYKRKQHIFWGFFIQEECFLNWVSRVQELFVRWSIV